MAKVIIAIACGCGYKTSNVAEASTHHTEFGHVMTIHGQLGEKQPKRK